MSANDNVGIKNTKLFVSGYCRYCLCAIQDGIILFSAECQAVPAIYRNALYESLNPSCIQSPTLKIIVLIPSLFQLEVE